MGKVYILKHRDAKFSGFQLGVGFSNGKGSTNSEVDAQNLIGKGICKDAAKEDLAKEKKAEAQAKAKEAKKAKDEALKKEKEEKKAKDEAKKESEKAEKEEEESKAKEKK